MRRELPTCSLPCVACGFAALQFRQWLRRCGHRLGVGRPRPLDEASLRAPDSPLCLRARDLAREAYDSHLLGHGMRTWANAVAVAAHLELGPDPEALFVACLLHDLGLTPSFAGPGPFELRGAEAARSICLTDARRAQLVHDAIAMHTYVGAAVGPPEIRLVQSGSGGDLVGLDVETIHPDTRRAIAARWPKAPGFSDSVLDALRRETRPHPESPGAGLLRVGFAGRVHAFHRSRR